MSAHSKLCTAAVAATLVAGSAAASTINQNTSWTLTRSGATSTYRVVAYGDSIYAGYTGSISSVAKRAAPHVEAEYLGTKWNATMEIMRRTKSGAKADDIYNNKIIGEKSYMQSANTRVVTFEMCGNDYLQARTAFQDQTGTCNYSGLDTALANCVLYTERAMQAINQYATNAKVKVVSNLFYPGFNADNVQTNCTDPSTGTKINKRAKFIPYLAKSNWRTCNLAAQYGFKCVDAFAEFMGADYDTGNGDGKVDSEALRFVAGESEAAYVTRITSTLLGTIRDSNTHYTTQSTSFDYLQSDDTHPTFYSSSTISVSFFSGSGSGSGAAEFTNGQIVNGQNPQWNRSGHERMGYGNSVFNPATP